MPFIAWGNGACTLNAGQYENFLVEIASYGYLIAADGTPNGGSAAQSKVQEMRDSVDWAFKGGAKKYGNIDLAKTTTAGHSCGGLEGMSVAYHDERYMLTFTFVLSRGAGDSKVRENETDWCVGSSGS